MATYNGRARLLPGVNYSASQALCVSVKNNCLARCHGKNRPFKLHNHMLMGPLLDDAGLIFLAVAHFGL